MRWDQATPNSLRTIRAPSASALSFIFAIMRGSGFIPQTVLRVTRSGGRTLSTFLIRSATCSGVSIIIVRMSSTPTCTFGVENRSQRIRQLARVLVVFEVHMPREIDRPRADRHLQRPRGIPGRDFIQIDEPDR